MVLAPDTSSGVVGVAVHYDVGFRSEPEGRTGFAHLFEHLMFQGSESLPKLEHFRLVQSSGGIFNGSTHTDYTDYFEVLPAAALERGLFLEADRMRAPRITAENLANQVDVVSEEIRLNVLNRPYGGFPWIDLPPVLFETFANAHNGYGDFVDLNAATVADCADFFERYYTPANAVLTVCGDFDDALVERVGPPPFRRRPVPAGARASRVRRAPPQHRAQGGEDRSVGAGAGVRGGLAAARSGGRPARLPGSRAARTGAVRRRIVHDCSPLSSPRRAWPPRSGPAPA